MSQALKALDSDTTVIDGMDQALIGEAQVWGEDGSITPRAVYHGDEIIKVLVERDGMSLDEAVEFCSFNIEGAYVGKDTPIIVWGAGTNS